MGWISGHLLSRHWKEGLQWISVRMEESRGGRDIEDLRWHHGKRGQHVYRIRWVSVEGVGVESKSNSNEKFVKTVRCGRAGS